MRCSDQPRSIIAWVSIGRSRMSRMPLGGVEPPSKSVPRATRSSPTNWIARSTTLSHSFGVSSIFSGISATPTIGNRGATRRSISSMVMGVARDLRCVPERLAGVRRAPLERLHVMEFVADLKPEHAALHREMIQRMGAFLERDPRWIGYWHSFGVDHFHDLPRRETRDVQMFRPI